eukprot:TRINITY_DN9944_c0_g1_i2.p2 TRINITY_DN9944_c0_g1~~TRINITY_DN9944_c0_g1_i2.p2  ORF type:complete len:202 (+),score=28.64 TRINITY_DN9944_c0_g1_i2:83-688(+)
MCIRDSIRSNNMFGGNVTVDSTKAPRSRSFRKLLAETVEDENATFHNSFQAGSFVEDPRVEEEKNRTMPPSPTNNNPATNDAITMFASPSSSPAAAVAARSPTAIAVPPSPAREEDKEQQRSTHFDVEGETSKREGDRGEVDAVVGRNSMRSSSGLGSLFGEFRICLLYTSDAADEEDSVDLGGRRITKKKKHKKIRTNKT